MSPPIEKVDPGSSMAVDPSDRKLYLKSPDPEAVRRFDAALKAQPRTPEKAYSPAEAGSLGVAANSTTKGSPSEDGRTSTRDTTTDSVTISDDGVKVGWGTTTKTTTESQEQTADGDPRDTSTRTQGVNGSININPDVGSVTLSGGTEFSEKLKTAGGYGVSFGISSNLTATSGVNTQDGVTTFSASTDVSVTLKGGVSTPRFGAEIGHTEGIKAAYSVGIPEEAATAVNLATVNPFDPTSMPEGTLIKLDGADYTRNEFKLTFKNLAVQTKVTKESGVSVAVGKIDDSTVRVTAGPTEAIKAYNGVGFNFEHVSLMLGRNDSLSGATLKTAEFDLSTTGGQAQYNDFLATGELPVRNGSGVSEVATIEKLDYDSQAKFDLTLGPVNLGFEGAQNTGARVRTTLADGTSTETLTLQYTENVPLAVSGTFDANGNDVMSQRQYSYTIEIDSNNQQMLNTALTGDVNQALRGPVQEGQTVALTFTESQMRTLMNDTRAAASGSDYYYYRDMQVLSGYDNGRQEFAFNTPEEFAYSVARNRGSSDYGIVSRLFEIADHAGGSSDGQWVKIDAGLTILSS